MHLVVISCHPWSFTGGHLISAGIGLICSHLFTDLALVAAVTIGCVLFVMYLFECMHPPGGATALVPVLSDQGFHHIPVLNVQRQLVGVITQSDLIAALFNTTLDNTKQA